MYGNLWPRNIFCATCKFVCVNGRRRHYTVDKLFGHLLCLVSFGFTGKSCHYLVDNVIIWHVFVKAPIVRGRRRLFHKRPSLASCNIIMKSNCQPTFEGLLHVVILIQILIPNEFEQVLYGSLYAKRTSAVGVAGWRCAGLSRVDLIPVGKVAENVFSFLLFGCERVIRIVLKNSHM